MKPRLSRALLVVAVFALLAAVTAAGSYMSDEGHAPPSPVKYKPIAIVFWANFRYYLAWAILTPLVFWLSRKVPIVRQRWHWAVAFHLLVPFVCSVPFFTFRLFLNAGLSLSLPPLHIVPIMWWRIFSMESVSILPIYWTLLAAGSALQFYRDYEAKEIQAVELRRSLAAAQLDALRMKLQPHFLFNTLNAIGNLARVGETDDVVSVVDHLGTMLRLSMETSGRQFVTLDEELRLLDTYLAIEEVRFKDRLRVVRHVEPGIGRALIPNLILQPLVEHAIEHGLSRRIDASQLEIAAEREGDLLCVSVRDDGPGLPAGWRLTRDAGRGLANVAERLRALYAEAGTIQVDNAADGGTVARLRIPLTVDQAVGGGSEHDGTSAHDHRR